MRRPFVLMVMVAAAVMIAAPVAQADQPIITPFPNTDYVDTTSCAFPVSVHFTVNDETAKIFTNGKLIVTGPLFADYSANGKSVTLDISGQGIGVILSDGALMIIGHGVAAGPLVTPNGLVLSYVAGVVSISTSPTLMGVLEQGTVILDICAALEP